MLTEQQIERHTWLRKNRGILTRIATETGYCRCMVSLVFNKHRPSVDGSIEERLRAEGAPGWPARKQARKA